MRDRFNRNIDYIRISLTDRCNLRCVYCIPKTGIKLLEHKDILSYEEILELAKHFISLGIKNFKITGGEPLVRHGVSDFVSNLKSLDKIGEVTLTTNGVLLEEQGEKLIEAGIDRINVSLDTLDRHKYFKVTRRNELDKVLRGIDLILNLGFRNLKLNVVPLNFFSLDDFKGLIDYAEGKKISIRFIRLMPVGIGNSDFGYKKDDILEYLEKNIGRAKCNSEKLGNGPATYYSFENKNSKIGFIDAIDCKFCSSCNRVRLTSTGFLKSCLNYDIGENLRPYIFDVDKEILREKIFQTIYNKPLMHQLGFNSIRKDYSNMNQIGG